MRYLRAAVVALVLIALPTTAFARIPLIKGDDSYLDLSGYVQSVSGVQYVTYDLPIGTPASSGLNAEVIRLEFSGQATDKVHLEFHDRLFFQVSSIDEGLSTGTLTGLGATAQPDRSLDLSTTLVDENGFSLDNDIDRAAATIYTDAADITLGRQAITWGRGVIFPVADLWTKFSPFELDQTQKRGTDAARVLVYPNYTTELDFVVADKGSFDDLSGGVRAAKTFDWGDGFVAAGKFWNEIIAMAGVTATSGHVRGRIEAAGPFNLDDGEVELPRVTVGGDYIASDAQLTVEYYFNGPGAAEPDGYFAQLNSDIFARGESYFLGRHYVGAAASYSGFERINLSLSAIANIGDPSVMIAPNFRYVLSDEADINVGAFQGLGDGPQITFPPQINSEYGTYGGFVFTQLRVFY